MKRISRIDEEIVGMEGLESRFDGTNSSGQVYIDPSHVLRTSLESLKGT